MYPMPNICRKMPQVRSFQPLNSSIKDGRSQKGMQQFHEIVHVCNQFQQHIMNMDESFVVSFIIINTLRYKKSLKHQKDNISIEDQGSQLRIEEEFRKNNSEEYIDQSTMVHMVEGKKEESERVDDYSMNFEYIICYSLVLGLSSCVQNACTY